MVKKKKEMKEYIKASHVDVHGQQGYDKFPNQWEIMVKKPKPKNPFCAIEDRFMYPAMRDLSGTEFKLYCYCCDNMNNFEFALSKESVCNKTGISAGGYDKAKRSLRDKGYLIHVHEIRKCEECAKFKDCEHKACNNVYFFSPVPQQTLGKIKDWFEWCNKTNENGFAYSDDDWNYGEPENKWEGDEEYGHRNSKFSYHTDE